MDKSKVIAFYLPQFHPTEDNNKWWGEGFTEWTNVGKAKMLYKNHYQPKVPADLGYYDLRLSDIRTKQAILAKEAGIYGFCYYHYWFGAGKQELELPFNEVVKTKEPDFPFCLCWANESWNKKFWNPDGTCDKEVLIQQSYDKEDGNRRHFYSLLDAFNDHRYIKINNKLLFIIYKPLDFENINDFMLQWDNLAKEHGLNGFYFLGHTSSPDEELNSILNLKLRGVISVRINNCVKYFYNKKKISGLLNHIIRVLFKRPFVIEYNKCIEILSEVNENTKVIPTILPNWDHTPRSGRGGFVLHRSTPKFFKLHLKTLFKNLKEKPRESNLIFLKSWNEWGEGNYMEPDIIFGKQYIQVLKSTLDEE